MSPARVEIPELYLQPGEFRLVRTPTVMKTVLGSCLGITFWTPRLGAAAMCHPMLPSHAARPVGLQGTSTGARYVDYAIQELVEQFKQLGATREEVEVKLFGGADVLTTARRDRTVGSMNAESALRVLKQEGLSIRASRLGGTTGVFIEFHTLTGEVLLRRLSGVSPTQLART